MMEVNSVDNNMKDGDDGTPSSATDAPSPVITKQKLNTGLVKKKRRRGKSKRKVMKPYMKMPWPDKKINDQCKRNNRFRKIALSKSHAPAPFNNNQFLMEIHKPEPENDFQITQTPSARTRDSSFSVDSEENYFYSLPEDEEDFLTKEFSSVYEDAQSERLSNMSKTELIEEYLLLEAKYESLVKKTRPKYSYETEKDGTDKETMITDKDSMVTDKVCPVTVKDAMVTDKDGLVTDRDGLVADRDAMVMDKDGTVTDKDTSNILTKMSVTDDEPSQEDYLLRLKEKEEEISNLKLTNEKLLLENERLRQKSQCSSSEDSESDSSSTSDSCSTSSRASTPVIEPAEEELEVIDIPIVNLVRHNGLNGYVRDTGEYPLVNGHNHGDEIEDD